MKQALLFLILLSTASLPLTAGDVNPATVEFVDVERYMGVWYEIARKPNFFQRKCGASRATYQLRDDGKIRVVNSCFEKNTPSRLKEATGTAQVADPNTNAKLKVSFVPILSFLFKADYWIVELDEDYRWAAVSNKKGNYLWILSRTPIMKEEVYEDLLDRLKLKGLQLDDLSRSPVWPDSEESSGL